MKIAVWVSGLLWTPLLSFVACGGGEDAQVKCTTTSQCESTERCEAGYCQPACTPGIDCPEKDASTSDVVDAEDVGPSDGEDDGDSPWTESDSQGADTAEDDTSIPGDTTQMCQPDRVISSLDGGKLFKVRFGNRESEQVVLPEGWTVAPACCTAGCCQ